MKIALSSDRSYPVELLYGCLVNTGNADSIGLPRRYPYAGVWGVPDDSQVEYAVGRHADLRADILWFSIAESAYYRVDVPIPVSGDTECLVIGLAPFGVCCLWEIRGRRQMLAATVSGTYCNERVGELFEAYPGLRKAWYGPAEDDRAKSAVYGRYYDFNPVRHDDRELANGFKKRLQQFTYRYLPLFGSRNETGRADTEQKDEEPVPQFEYLEESLCDGTCDKLYDAAVSMYRRAGKPKRLIVAWRIGKTEYVACFRFAQARIRAVFDTFYGVHPDTKADLIIRLDPPARRYGLNLYRYGMREPVVLSENAYRLIVFKNGFEHYRSENYDREQDSRDW